jgi:hypothetical protein
VYVLEEFENVLDVQMEIQMNYLMMNRMMKMKRKKRKKRNVIENRTKKMNPMRNSMMVFDLLDDY